MDKPKVATVSQLIDILREMPGDAPVAVGWSEDSDHMEQVVSASLKKTVVSLKVEHKLVDRPDLTNREVTTWHYADLVPDSPFEAKIRPEPNAGYGGRFEFSWKEGYDLASYLQRLPDRGDYTREFLRKHRDAGGYLRGPDGEDMWLETGGPEGRAVLCFGFCRHPMKAVLSCLRKAKRVPYPRIPGQYLKASCPMRQWCVPDLLDFKI